MITLLTLLAGLAVVLVITAVTGYFVAQEFAYMSVDRSRLKASAGTGDAAAKRALKVTGRTSFMLSGAQLGITVTGLLVGYVAEPLIGQSLGTMLGGVGIPQAVGVGVGTLLALLIATGIQMIFGELFPKNLAIARPEPVARRLATSTLLYLKVAGWLIWVFDQSSNVLLRTLRIEPVHDVEHSATARDLEHILAESRAAGDLPPELSMLLDRVLEFPDQTVEHAMIPRVRVDTVSVDATLTELRERMSGGHSRYPVLDEGERVVGVVHLVDVLALGDDVGELTAGDLAQPALMVPTLMHLPEAVRELTRTNNQLACVLDEYGGFDGVLTVEDLAEELVGEITDEHDADPGTDVQIDADERSWTVRGSSHVDELERALGHELPPGDYETIAGLAIAAHGRFPDVGDVVTVVLPLNPGTYAQEEDPRPMLARLEVLEVTDHIPSLLRIELESPSAGEEL